MVGPVRQSTLRPSRTQQRRGRQRPSLSRPSRNLLVANAAAPDAPPLPFGFLSSGMVDFYEILGVDDDAPTEEIKRAYRAMAKECHPDYTGDKGHDMCVLLNEAYEVLSNPKTRSKYDATLEKALADEDDGYTGQPLSKWMPTQKPGMAKNVNPLESRAIFVDEVACIGCRNCVWCAPATFRMEGEYGRSRVFAQWLDNEDHLQTAIDSCPVSCIHWVDKEDLPALEHVMQTRVERVNVGVMMAGQGSAPDVFDITRQFQRKRRETEEARAKAARYYSPSQEEARRRAAQELAEQHLGVFSRFSQLFSTVHDSMRAAVDPDGNGRVGGRKRSQHWYERDAAPASGRGASSGGGEPYSVPPERAIVPISVYAKERDI